MSQNQTLARPYAKAVFELGLADHALRSWSEQLSLAKNIASDPQMISVLKDPQFSMDQVVDMFVTIGKNVFTEQMCRFIVNLAKAKRLAYLPEIAELFEAYKAQSERVIHVTLISAMPVHADYQQRISEALTRRTDCQISLACVTDKSIMGGAIIKADDLVIDGSVLGRLAKLSDAVGIS